MALNSTPVSRSLDRRLKIFGFDPFEIILIFLLLSILKWISRGTEHVLLFVWLPPLILAGVLRIAGRGKPPNFLLHWIRFQVLPGTFRAFDPPSTQKSFRINRGRKLS